MDFQETASADAADDDEPPYVEIPKINVLTLAAKVGISYIIYHEYYFKMCILAYCIHAYFNDFVGLL